MKIRNLAFALFSVILFFSSFTTEKKIYITRAGHVWFYSKATLENIEAHNRQVSSALNTNTDSLAFSVLIKGFEFEKALMQEHFNENYLESDKYPKATFRGRILNMKNADYVKAGTYNVDVEGDLTIHGVTNHVKSKGTLTVDPTKNTIAAQSSFPVRLKDYNISIPSIVKEKIAEVVDVHVDMLYLGK